MSGETDDIPPMEAAENNKAKRKRPAADGADSTDAVMIGLVAKELAKGRFIWTGGMGWFEYDGKVWKKITEKPVEKAVRRYFIEKFAEAESATEREKYGPFLRRPKYIGVVKGLESETERKDTAFDNHPDLLNTPSGVVDLRTGEILPHDPGLLFTKITRARYDPEVESPDWEMIKEALPPEDLAYMQYRIGEAITGYMTSDDVLPICQGAGENGKTTFFYAITRALGSYYTAVSDRVIMANPSDHPTELTDLKGARLALIEETPEARRLSVARLKKVLGTPTMTARLIRKDNMTWESTHSLFVTTNYRPVIEETDHGTWRRLQLIQFPYKFTSEPKGPNERKGDPDLRKRIPRDRAVRQAALRWAVEGAVRLAEEGGVLPEPPASVRDATREWRQQTDVILRYTSERLRVDSNAYVMATDLLLDFNVWNGTYLSTMEWKDRTFAGRFKGHDFYSQNDLSTANARTNKPGLSRPTDADGTHVLPGCPVLVARGMMYRGVAFVDGTDQRK